MESLDESGTFPILYKQLYEGKVRSAKLLRLAGKTYSTKQGLLKISPFIR